MITSIVLPSSDEGWELWALGKSEPELKTHFIGAIDKLNVPAGSCVALPVRCLATMPLHVPSDDPDLYRGAAELLLEKGSFLASGETGRSWDCKVVEKRGNEVIVAVSVLVEDRLEDEHKLNHVSFDSSARLIRPKEMGDVVAFWKENGEWVLACYRDREVFYTEPLGSVDGSIDLTIDLLRSQFLVKGIPFHLKSVWCWMQGTDEEMPDALKNSHLGVHVARRPIPEMPASQLTLQPSEVVAWHGRQAVLARNRLIFMALGALYLVGLGFLWWKDHQSDQKIATLNQEIAGLQPAWESNMEHFDRWNELSSLVSDRWPLNLYKECAMLLPANQSIRFQQIEVQEALIVIHGSSLNLNAIAKYSLGLKRSSELEGFVWSTPSETRDPKTNQWAFRYEAKNENLTEPSGNE